MFFEPQTWANLGGDEFRDIDVGQQVLGSKLSQMSLPPSSPEDVVRLFMKDVVEVSEKLINRTSGAQSIIVSNANIDDEDGIFGINTAGWGGAVGLSISRPGESFAQRLLELKIDQHFRIVRTLDGLREWTSEKGHNKVLCDRELLLAGAALCNVIQEMVGQEIQHQVILIFFLFTYEICIFKFIFFLFTYEIVYFTTGNYFLLIYI